MNVNFCIFLILILTPFTYQDIPVHCTLPKVIGSWEVEISKDLFTPSLSSQEPTSCGHGMPNTVRTENLDDSISNSNTFKIRFERENKVFSKNNQIGTFTFVFDEAIIINIDNPLDNGKKAELMFHFRYVYKSENNYTSDCGKTLRGWFIPDTSNRMSNWSCAYAQKGSTESSSITSAISFAQISEKTEIDNRETTYTLNKNHKYEETSEFANHLNKSNNLWKAGINNNFIGLTIEELYNKIHKKKRTTTPLNEFLQHKSNKVSAADNINMIQIKSKFKTKNLKTVFENEKKKKNKSRSKNAFKAASNDHYIYDDPSVQKERDSKDETDMEVVTKYINTKIEDIDLKKLPKNWDWSNVAAAGTKKFTPPVQNQGDCGSCYTMASVAGLNTRLRILTKLEDTTRMSENFFLNKSFYTEGCDGGYPVLLGKFGKEFGLASTQCADTYDASSGVSGNSINMCNLDSQPKKYYVSDYGYIGGYYGNSSEADMVRELRARGPILGNVRVPSSLMYYQSGIYHYDYTGGKNAGKWNTQTMYGSGKYVQQVEHSTLIVGYGEEDGVKYWKLMNSWGEDWGEKGFYKIVRGENEMFVESMGDYLQIGVK